MGGKFIGSRGATLTARKCVDVRRPYAQCAGMNPTKRNRVTGYAAPGEVAAPEPAPVPEAPTPPAAADEMLDTEPEKADTRQQMKAKAKSRSKPAARKGASKAAPKRKVKRASGKSKSSTKLSSPSASKRLPGQPAKSRR